MAHTITIDKCQGCRHWHLGIADKECALCGCMPFREDGHPYNYDEQVIITTTTTEENWIPSDTPSQIQPLDTRTKPKRNGDRFDNAYNARQAWKREYKDSERAIELGLDTSLFEKWLFERVKND